MARPLWFLIALLSLHPHSRAQNATVFTTPMTAPDVPQGLIRLDVTATDPNGKPATGLTAENFTLLDNNQPRPILSFHPSDKTDPPARVILFVDVLNAPSDIAVQIENEAGAFLRRNGGHLTHPVSVYRFSEEGLGRVGLPSMDGNALASEVEKGHQALIQSSLHQDGSMRGVPNTFSAFTNPMDRALQAIAKIGAEERQKPGRKVMLWVGPGFGVGTGAYLLEYPHQGPDARRERLQETEWFYTLMRDARIVVDVFSVGPQDPPAPALGGQIGAIADNPLPPRYTTYLSGINPTKLVSQMLLYKKILAIQSGGVALEPTPNLIDQMEASVRNADTFYTLSFNPPETAQPNDYHTLAVKLADTARRAQAATGYFDQPYYTDQADATTSTATVQQLEQILRESHGKRDTAIADELSHLRLTERLDGSTLTAFAASLGGDKARQQLIMLADASAFLDPPPSDIPIDARPDRQAQQQMIARARQAVSTSIPSLPNVFAARTTVRYQENSQYADASDTMVTQPLHKVDTSNVMVAYRQGSEVIEAALASPRKPKPGEPSLIINGTFGPLLSAAIDILSNPDHMTWKRWGSGPTGRRAVFSYNLPATALSFGTTGCCLPDEQGTNAFPRPANYRGEIEIDAATGALLRIELLANPRATTPSLRADALIEYGPVEIAGKTYVCPIHSIALTRARDVIHDFLGKPPSRTFTSDTRESFRTFGPYETQLNDITFSNYHVFRAQSRILTSLTPLTP